jgi:phosphopantothenoylcysteine decarboxylase/phosphopantothenate--cysteine ligase
MPPADEPLTGREVLLCLSGGVACYKSADLASKLVQAGAGVTAAMTAAARRFLAPLTLQALTGRRVHTSLWTAAPDARGEHIALSELADLTIVAPATANVLAKLAAGIADDLVSTLALSITGRCPLLLAPAMNPRMWQAPATRASVERLRSWGAHLVGPAEGRVACGDVGPGRMAEPDDILAAARDLLGGELAERS